MHGAAPGGTPTPLTAAETDYYELLQISPSAEPETIHRVYRLLEGKVSLTGKPGDIGLQDVSRAYFGV